MSLLGKRGGAWLDVLGSKVLLDVGVRVWRQQIRGAAASLSKAQQDQESETLVPKKLKTALRDAGGRRIFRFGRCVCVAADVPSFPRSASLDAACVASLKTVSISRLGSVLRSRCGGVVSFEQFSRFRGVICFLPQLNSLCSLLPS